MSNRYDIPIGIVERDTGLSKEVLRKWELRYGFPLPVRSDSGVRLYSAEQLGRLRTIKRLMDSGMRAAQAVSLDEEELERFASAVKAPLPPSLDGGVLADVLQMLSGDNAAAVQQLLAREQLQRGLQNLILDVIAPLTTEVGNAWADGTLQVHHEHLYAEAVQDLLRASMSRLAAPSDGPRILLATPPGELHTLGILMLHALLNLQGAVGISLGAQVPAAELAQAAVTHRAQIVAVSFSIAFPARAVAPFLADLRRQLPEHVALWAGGAGTARLKRMPTGVLRMSTLNAAMTEVQNRSAAR